MTKKRSTRVPPQARAALMATAFAALVAPWSAAAATSAEAPPDPSAWSAIRCVDVAAEVGLDFVGSYGTTIAGPDGGDIMQRNMGQGAAVGDYDRDGDLDIYLLAMAGHANALFRNDEDPAGGRSFTEVAEDAGVADVGLGRMALFADLDGDDWLDLVVLNDSDPAGRLPPSRIFRNERDGTFSDVTEGSGFEPIGYLASGAAAVDVDGDLDLDLYTTVWTQELGGSVPGEEVKGSFPGHNRLYRNDGDFRFTDITERSGLGGITRDSFTPIFADFDGDRDPDLYIPVDHRADLYFENRKGRFRDRSTQAGVEHAGNDMGVAVSDINADGAFDLFVTNIFDPEENFGSKPRGNTLLLSEGSGRKLRFTDRAYDYGVMETGWGWGTAFVDLDLDGTLELYAVQGFDEFVDVYSDSLFDEPASLFVTSETLPWARTSGTGCEVQGDQRALLPFDYDLDGDADLLITQVDLPVMLLENRSDRGRWLTVRLEDRAGWGSGARVDVTVDGRTTTHLVMHGGSYLAGMPLEVTFGLGDAESAERVVVTDIRGRRVVRRDVPADRVVEIGPER